MNNSALKQLELETLLEITSTLFIHDNLNDLLHDILIRTCGILDASSGFILIEEKNSDLFVPKATFNLDEKILSKIIFNKKRGFLHSLAEQNNTCLHNEKNLLDKLNKSFSLAAAVNGKEKMLGVILIFDKEQRIGISDFSDVDALVESLVAAKSFFGVK